MTPEEKKEVAKLLHVADVIASEPYPNPEGAVIYLIKVLTIMNKEHDDDKETNGRST